MTPTETNILIALLATVFGFAIRHAWAYFYLDNGAIAIINQWEKQYKELRALKTKSNFATARYAYEQGFRAGVKMADDEEADDELYDEMLSDGALMGEELMKSPSYTSGDLFKAIFPKNSYKND